MRICMFSRIMPAHSPGGMQDHVQTLSEELTRAGHQVTVITSGRADGKEYDVIGGVQVHFLESTKPGRYSAAYWRSSAQKFVQLHSVKPFGVIHSQSVGAHGIYREGLHRKYSVPLVMSLHGTHVDVVTTSWHTDFSLVNPLGMARFGAIAAKMFFDYARRDLWFVRGSDVLIATSDADVGKYKSQFGLSDAQIRKVYNGIDAELFAPQNSDSAESLRHTLRIRDDEKVILALARLQKDKGVQNVIRVMPRLREYMPVRLVVVGDGDYRAALEALARNVGAAEEISFVGAQPLAECARYFNLCDVFVDPTLRTDGYDLTIAEAMACAKPVIVSDVGANSTLVDRLTQKDGILISRGDNEALSREILRVLSDAELAKAMGSLAREKIVAHFSLPAMANGMAQVYEEVIRRKSLAASHTRLIDTPGA